MSMLFADTLKKLRTEKGLSQRKMAERLFVTRSAIAKWENGSRLPDIAMIRLIAEVLGASANTLLSAAVGNDERPAVIMVDDNAVILNGGRQIIEEVIPNAYVTGFTKPSEAIEYAKTNHIAIAFLDIEMGAVSGLDICSALLEINPNTNVIYLTAYSNYSLDAWNTGACGFMLKPITPDGVREQLKKLRYPIMTGGEET